MSQHAMNFPVWDLHAISGGLLIAIIAVMHVFVAHFAVGGGFFLVFAEARGHRQGSQRVLQWVQRQTRFFLLLALVFGGLSGVGVWVAVSLVSPAGASLLVREFAFALAAGWAFFLGGILALLLYAASFPRCRDGSMPPRDHMILGGAYALFAFLSLVIINGIVSFMLTPGDWPVTGSFWSAFFNPGFFPSLAFRAGLALTLAGVFGLVTSTSIKDGETREDMVRFCAQWVCLPFVLMLAGIIWYGWALPEDALGAVQRGTDDIRPFVRSFLDTAPLLFLGGMFLFIRLPQKVYKPYVAVMLLLGLIVAGSFEWIRETARRPWLVRGHMYSNGITLADGKRMNEEGVLAVSGWARLRAGHEAAAPAPAGKAPEGTAAKDAAAVKVTLDSLSPEGRARFGRFLYTQQCANCHGLGAPMLDIKPRVRDLEAAGIDALLASQGRASSYMPPFFGAREERRVLAEWLASLKLEQ